MLNTWMKIWKEAWWALFPTSLLLQTEPIQVSIPFPMPYPVETPLLMGWHWAAGNEWDIQTDPDVGGHWLEHFSACACLPCPWNEKSSYNQAPPREDSWILRLHAWPGASTPQIQTSSLLPQKSSDCSFQIRCLYLRSGKWTLGTSWHEWFKDQNGSETSRSIISKRQTRYT